MKNIKATIEYDGTNFNGFQKQKNRSDLRTVQGSLEKAGEMIFKQRINILGSGRTDAKVHALGQVISFKVDTKIETEKIAEAFNTRLPDDIVMKETVEVDMDFDARKSAKKKTYRYIINNKELSALNRNRELYYKYNLDLDRMKKAAILLEGTHDFRSFMSKNSGKENTIRTVYKARINEINGKIIFEITANGFLYNMVRIIIGTLLEIGNNKKEIEDITRILEAKNRQLAGKRVEAYGLYLVSVEY